MPVFAPHPYQARAIQYVLGHPACALWVEPGLGKTSIVLAAASTLLERFEVLRILVVAPLRVAASTWPDEAQKWGFPVRVRVIRGTPTQRRRLIAEPGADLWTINYELLPWLVAEQGRAWPWDMVVLDEASKVKDRSTRRWKALRKVCRQVSRLVELTGTPAPNGLTDVWAPIALLDHGEALGRTLTAYRQRWFESDFLGYTWTPRAGAAEEIHARLRGLCLTMRAEDYLTLPDLVPVTLPVDLDPKARALYRKIETEMFAELAGAEVTAWNAAAVSNKCRQICQGAVYPDQDPSSAAPARGWAHIHDAKIDALADLLDELPGEPVLVAYQYRHDLERLLARFPRARVLDKDPATIRDWNAGRIRLLLAHPASAGHGLNLQSGGHVLVWFGLDWNLELYLQFNARLHRQGQARPVMVYHIVVRNSVDELVLQRLVDKRSVQDILLDALKQREGTKDAVAVTCCPPAPR